MIKVTDDEIINAMMQNHGGTSCVTYVIRNILRPKVANSEQILARLKLMERLGRVRRSSRQTRSNMIEWDVVDKPGED